MYGLQNVFAAQIEYKVYIYGFMQIISFLNANMLIINHCTEPWTLVINSLSPSGMYMHQ